MCVCVWLSRKGSVATGKTIESSSDFCLWDTVATESDLGHPKANCYGGDLQVASGDGSLTFGLIVELFLQL